MSVETGLRILLAHDLSGDAERAAALVAGTAWPGGTTVTLVTSPAGIGPGLSSFAMISEARAHVAQARDAIIEAHDRLATDLRDVGVLVESRIVDGPPGRAIVDEARRIGADLVVVGAREQGSVAAAILGSVSREVVDRAPCSVLVARQGAVSRVLVATDGSPAALLATTMVATWPLFRGLRTLVVGVGEAPPGYAGVVLEDAEEAYPGTLAHGLDTARSAVDAAVSRLTDPARDIQREVRLGDPAAEVIAAARGWAADLVAIGANSEPTLRRLVMGSVARRILDDVDASVLVARPRSIVDDDGAREDR